jgi:hypothetical protein
MLDLVDEVGQTAIRIGIDAGFDVLCAERRHLI